MNLQFNVSPSSLNLWRTSELQFYYQYIIKAEPDINLIQIYGQSGNCVHESLEHYHKIKDKEQVKRYFDKRWEELELHKNPGFNGKPLDKQVYWDAVVYGMERMDNDFEIEASELRLEFPIDTDIMIKGFVDNVAVVDGQKEIVDWKTSSKIEDGENFRIQTLFYSHLYWCKTGEFIQRARIVYLKLKKDKVYDFTIDEIANFKERYVKPMLQDIRTKGFNEFNYDLGAWDSPFNAHLEKCRAQTMLRQPNNIIAYRQDNLLKFPNSLPRQLMPIVDALFSYKQDGYQFAPAYKAKQWDGKIRFLKKDTLPYAYIHKLNELIAAFNKRAGTNYHLEVVDKRDQSVVNAIYTTTFTPTEYVVRMYQEFAVQIALEKKIGVLALSVAAGKTFIAGEIIRRTNRRTLFVVNRRELLNQTAEVFEEELGVTIGRMVEGQLDIDNQVTVASIQTIVAILKRNDASTIALRTYLYNVTCVIYDESHNCADKGLYGILMRELRNVEYCIALTGTPFRNYQPETLEMNALTGFPIYTKTSAELEAEGFLAPVDIRFIDMPKRKDAMMFESYHENYMYHIVEHDERNEKIIDLVEEHRADNKIIVLVSRIAHGEYFASKIPNSFFLHGSVDMDIRKEKMEEFKTTDGMVLIGMTSILSEGIDIPSLTMMVMAASGASEIKVVQQVGRLRRHDKASGKEKGIYYDFMDEYDMFKAMSKKRMRRLQKEGYEVRK